ncbi:hypothetical protein U9M48_009867 [Paspalum notatum var. saurae]|uniref:Cytochrome P450 n=1 Tax=Paspalum notatum var. saurae TaxID=547442 RepID=A0AAQ3WFI2_PASNO
MDAIRIVCVTLGFVVILLKLIIRSRTSTSRRPPPGPWQLPLIGSLHHLLLSRFRGHPHRALREMSATYGPLMLLRFGSVDTLVASTAEAAREVMRTHDLAFCSRHLSATLDTISCGGKGILFSRYGDRWRDLRKVCMLELFHQRRVLSFRGVREEEVARLLRSVSGECAGGGGRAADVDLGEAICRMVNDIVVRTAIGGRCRYRDEFLRWLDEGVHLAGGFNLADLYPSSRLVRRFSVAARDMGRCQRNIHRIIEGIIHERAVTGMRMPEEREDDLLGVLLRLQKEGGLPFHLTNEIISTVILISSLSTTSIPGKKEEEVAGKERDSPGKKRSLLRLAVARSWSRGQGRPWSGDGGRRSEVAHRERRSGRRGKEEEKRGRDIFAAGSETSSTVLVWAMSELVKNPRVLHKAQSEVRETFKGQEKLTEDDMAKLSYLHLVLKEALRLHTPVPFLLPRECREACRVMGYDVTKGTKVFVNVWAISRDGEVWGDGEVFRPERFEGSGVDFRGNDFEFTPFGAGRRICPGITHGLANMELVLASLLYHFDWEVPGGGGSDELDMTEAFGITLRRKSKLVLKATPRVSFVSKSPNSV